MDSIKFTCIYCGAVVLSIFISAIFGVMITRTWEAEDDEDYFIRRCNATSIAWIISCMINGGFLAYFISIMR